MDTSFRLGNLTTNLPEKVDLSKGTARQPLRGGRTTQAFRGFYARFGPSCVAPRGSVGRWYAQRKLRKPLHLKLVSIAMPWQRKFRGEDLASLHHVDFALHRTFRDECRPICEDLADLRPARRVARRARVATGC